ncbi:MULTISPECIES: protealysin inhibitor emfourin [unclassified Streptomyces]|uniref:protealysin inhibitor emfourin n=1 Tax=unclassified Streptomyces TaxID=2593676 RepID=UPI00093FBF0B|nr:protealysin inhibitor emfourin [Streptomyces sp. CB02261]OKJ69473.1 metalloprotease [Streptomyces sp. CB02261]
MRIRVRRTGGFAGIERSAEVDTSGRPDAGDWHTLAEAVLDGGDEAAGEGSRGVPDGFSYEITIDGRTVHCDDPRLTEEQRTLITRVLKEGA